MHVRVWPSGSWEGLRDALDNTNMNVMSCYTISANQRLGCTKNTTTNSELYARSCWANLLLPNDLLSDLTSTHTHTHTHVQNTLEKRRRKDQKKDDNDNDHLLYSCWRLRQAGRHGAGRARLHAVRASSLLLSPLSPLSHVVSILLVHLIVHLMPGAKVVQHIFYHFVNPKIFSSSSCSAV